MAHLASPRLASPQAEEAMGRMWASKLGLGLGLGLVAVEGVTAVEGATAVLAQELLGMMGGHPCDYTLTWRQLAQVCMYMYVYVYTYVAGSGG